MPDLLRRIVPAIVIATLLPTQSRVDAQRPAARTSAAVDFARDIQPILQAHCYECHGSQKAQSGLRLDHFLNWH